MAETPAEKFARASSEMGGLEARLATVRAERVAAIEEMRADGMSWADVEKTTGLTRQRLWKMTAQNSSPGSSSAGR